MVRLERWYARLYVRHYSTTLRIPARKKFLFTQTSQTYTDFRERCSHHPDGRKDAEGVSA